VLTWGGKTEREPPSPAVDRGGKKSTTRGGGRRKRRLDGVFSSFMSGEKGVPRFRRPKKRRKFPPTIGGFAAKKTNLLGPVEKKSQRERGKEGMFCYPCFWKRKGRCSLPPKEI